MPRKPRPGEGMFNGLIIDSAPFMAGLEYSLYEKVDQQTISAKIEFRTGLSRYPAVWLEATLNAWRIPNRGVKRDKLHTLEEVVSDPSRLRQVGASLTDVQRGVLAQVLAGGGVVKYQTVSRKYGDEADDSYFWNSHPPTSAIGQLRLWGLLLVGRMIMGQRREKVLVVPSDLRADLAALLPTSSAADQGSAEERVFELEVDLLDVSPKIFRRFSVPGTITLSQLNRAIQSAMGWEGNHLYEFTVAGASYGEPDAEIGIKDARRVRLQAIVDRSKKTFQYTYDFGDDWRHRVTVRDVRAMRVGETVPRLIDGSRACPPEDVGGVSGYEEFVRVMADPTHPEYDDTLAWAGGPWDPEHFDRESLQHLLMTAARQGRWYRART